MMIFSAQRNTSRESGFTLVELMISMTIFTSLTIFGIGAVISATNQYNVSSNTRAIMDNLNFVMEDISRNLRTGGPVACVTAPSVPTSYVSAGSVTPNDCATTPSNVIVFRAAYPSNANIGYAITPVSGSTTSYQITKFTIDSTGAVTTQVVTPPEVTIDLAKSGFTVRGAKPTTATPADYVQPYVTIRLSGTITYKLIPTKFAIQTSVAVRQLDI